MSISDEGQGVPSRGVERVFFAVGPRVHALSLLRRRLKRLFGHSFRLEIESEVGRGTRVTMRLPRQFNNAERNRWKPSVLILVDWLRARFAFMWIRIRAVMRPVILT
jgi:signal transduction histidine kinase